MEGLFFGFGGGVVWAAVVVGSVLAVLVDAGGGVEVVVVAGLVGCSGGGAVIVGACSWGAGIGGFFLLHPEANRSAKIRARDRIRQSSLDCMVTIGPPDRAAGDVLRVRGEGSNKRSFLLRCGYRSALIHYAIA